MRVVFLTALLACALRAFAQSSPSPSPPLHVYVGAQLGFPHIVSVGALASLLHRGAPRFDVDFLWEPSGYLQSYSLGAAYHPKERMFFLGSRVRLLQLRPPWIHGFDAARDDHLGLGLEAGLRARVGPRRKVLVELRLQATGVPTQRPQLQWLIGLSLGVAYAVY